MEEQGGRKMVRGGESEKGRKMVRRKEEKEMAGGILILDCSQSIRASRLAVFIPSLYLATIKSTSPAFLSSSTYAFQRRKEGEKKEKRRRKEGEKIDGAWIQMRGPFNCNMNLFQIWKSEFVSPLLSLKETAWWFRRAEVMRAGVESKEVYGRSEEVSRMRHTLAMRGLE